MLAVVWSNLWTYKELSRQVKYNGFDFSKKRIDIAKELNPEGKFLLKMLIQQIYLNIVIMMSLYVLKY